MPREAASKAPAQQHSHSLQLTRDGPYTVAAFWVCASAGVSNTTLHMTTFMPGELSPA